MSDYFVVRRGATALPNQTVWDERIGFAALGILARALATPPGAHLGYRAFSGRGMGEKAVRSAMRELEAAGYRHRFPVRGDGGRLRTVTVFSDVAISEEEALAEYVGAEDRARVVGRRRPDDGPGDGPDAGPDAGSGGGGSGGGPSGSGPAPGGGGSYPQKGSPQESYPQDHGPASHRAAPPAARWPEPRNDAENSESTVRRSTAPRSTAPRSTAPRSTVPRSRTALPLRGTNSSSSSLRSEEGGTFNQTGPDRTEGAGTARAGAADRVRSGEEHRGSAEGGAGRARPPRTASAALDAAPVRAGDGSGNASRRPSGASGAAERASDVSGRGSGSEIASDRLSGLLGGCLPEWMRVMDAAGARAVGALLEARLAAGWRPEQIRAAMSGRRPERVGRMSALVASRLERNVDPALAPARGSAPDVGSASSAGAVGGASGAAAVRAAEDARWEARRRRSEALAAPVRRDEGAGEDPLWARALAQAARLLPGAGAVERARAAAGLVARWLADPAGAAVAG